MTTAIDASAEAGSGVPASPPRENLVRFNAFDDLRGIDLERDTGDGGMPTLVGHFAVFNRWTEIDSMWEGRFMERFAPGAFKKTISEGASRMRVLFDHGHDPTFGNKVLGPIRSLSEDSVGAAYEVPLLDTSYNRDLIPGLEAGLYGASFRFRVMQETFVAKPKRSAGNPEGIPERTVTEAQVMEFGPVTFPAYAEASAGLRSLTDDYHFRMLTADPERLAKLLARFRHPAELTEPEPPAATTLDENRATDEPEPPEATTRSNRRDLFWFAGHPKHKGAK